MVGARRAAILLFGTVLGLALPAALASPAGASPVPPRSVFVIGDSVMTGAADAVRADLPEWSATIGTWVGLGTRAGVDALKFRSSELGSVVVVELGLNDWGMAPSSYARLIDDAMAVLAGRHVVWLTAPRFRPEIDGINGAIRDTAGRHANLEVLEWGPLSDAHPEATYSDRIHLRPAGQWLMADAVRSTLERWWATVSHPCPVLIDETATNNAVARLYRAYFARDADLEGLNYWVPRYRSGELCLADISEFFAHSGEFAATYGALDVPNFVRRVYLNVLGREPDPDGYQYWALRLADGELRRGEVMLDFSESPEFRARTGLT